MRDEDETRVPCERCKGNGRRSAEMHIAARSTGYTIVTESVPCWLCEGIGSITATRLRWWHAADKPIVDPVPSVDPLDIEMEPESGDDKILFEDWIRSGGKNDKLRGD